MFEHIDFTRLEPNDAVDHQHLEACGECRRRYELWGFMQAQLSQVREIEPPPFFASRVAAIAAGLRTNSFWVFLEVVARRLTPVFAAMAFATSVLLYQQYTEQVPAEELGLLVEISAEPDVTLDDVILNLQPREPVP